jgi:hypothetical protein
VSAAIQQTLPDIFEGLPKNENEWPEELRQDLDVFVAATEEHNGLIPNAAAPACFGVTKQRWEQMSKDYNFKCWKLFGKRWYSRRQLEEFSRIDRKELRGHNGSKKGQMMRMLKETLSDASNDDA